MLTMRAQAGQGARSFQLAGSVIEQDVVIHERCGATTFPHCPEPDHTSLIATQTTKMFSIRSALTQAFPPTPGFTEEHVPDLGGRVS